jgi:hypothetical protein
LRFAVLGAGAISWEIGEHLESGSLELKGV